MEGGRYENIVQAYNAGLRGEDISRETRENAAASNTLDQVEQMYKAGQADAKTGSVDTGVSEAGTASSKGSPSVENGARPTETENGVQATENAGASPSTQQSDTAKTEQPGTTAQKPASEVNAELEAKLAPFKLNVEERTAAEEYARTGKDSAFSNKFDRDTVKRIMAAAEIIKEYNGKNGVDSQQGEGYNGNRGDGLNGPVEIMPPPNATPEQIVQTKLYIEGSNQALKAGALSPSGRVSTKGVLRIRANSAVAIERKRAANAGTPYKGHVGHVPDTTWTGSPEPYKWLDLDPTVNTSIGGQANKYPIGYKPTRFVYKERKSK